MSSNDGPNNARWTVHQHPKQPKYWSVRWGPFGTPFAANSDTAEQEMKELAEFLNSDTPTARIIAQVLLRRVSP